MGNEKRSTSEPGEGRQKKAKCLRRAGPSISDRDKHPCADSSSVYDKLSSYDPNWESAGRLAAPAAAAHSHISPSTPAPTTVSSRHEEYYAAPQAAYRSSVSDYTHDEQFSAAEEVTDSVTLNRVSITAVEGSVHGSRHNSRDMADLGAAQARLLSLSLSRVPESPIAERLWDRASEHGGVPFNTFTTPSERARASNDRNRRVQQACSAVTGSLTPPPDNNNSIYQQTIEVGDHDVEDHGVEDHDVEFPEISGYL